jgi:Uma2 family endonuclease
MAQPQQKRMTADEFLVWHLRQEDKFELVDGIPVLKQARSMAARSAMTTRMMAGGTLTHSRVASNIQGHLFAKLRGSPCQPYGSDLAVRTSIDQVRYPEVTVDCAEPKHGDKEAVKPIAVFEVLSPSTRTNDLQVKLAEYMRHPVLRTIVIIEPAIADVVVHVRDAANQWQTSRLRILSEHFVVPGPDVSLSLAEIYESIPLSADDATSAPADGS